jgi:SOS-response transcriptional repressor LexA
MTSAPQPAHTQLTDRQRGILDFIETNMRDRGYPPSVREIGEAVGLSSSATVHNHLAHCRNWVTSTATQRSHAQSKFVTKHQAVLPWSAGRQNTFHSLATLPQA